MSDGVHDSSEWPPLVPRDGLFEGQVAVEGETRIAGIVHGTLRGDGTLALEPGSRIEGVIDCDVVECHGTIVGPVTVRLAHLAAGSHFEGNLEAGSLEVDDEAIWNGVARVGH